MNSIRFPTDAITDQVRTACGATLMFNLHNGFRIHSPRIPGNRVRSWSNE
ncbi:hypothetical protein FHS01_000305 [Longimicrobium terrae]|uniref:Uncharacterized protein n=1 Tax=Longimicrobium terrae TaxID=1639882 RepID=A0A841GJE7_9BACT|nr:hypothetical protein [Longimicrobium terrae]MBB6068811.1 hypothetical protein [Longimicrobium terrae]